MHYKVVTENLQIKYNSLIISLKKYKLPFVHQIKQQRTGLYYIGTITLIPVNNCKNSGETTLS